MSSTSAPPGGTSSGFFAKCVPAGISRRVSVATFFSSEGVLDSFSERMLGFSVLAVFAAGYGSHWITYGDEKFVFMCVFSGFAMLSLLAPTTSCVGATTHYFCQVFSYVRFCHLVAALPSRYRRFFVVSSQLRNETNQRPSWSSLRNVCSQQAYYLSDRGTLEEETVVLESQFLSGLNPAWAWCSSWVSFASEPVFQGVWSVAGPIHTAGKDRGRGAVFVTQAGENEEFNSHSGTIYSTRFKPGIIICRSGYLWCCKPREGSGHYVNSPESGDVSRKLVVWGSITESFWDYLAVLGVVNTLSLLVVVMAGGQGRDVTVVFSINLATELVAICLCLREVFVRGHGSLMLGSALDPVSALRFLSSSSDTVVWVLVLEIGSAAGGMFYLGIQGEWLLVAVGTGISVMGCAVSAALLPPRALWLMSALVLYFAEFIVEGTLASRSPDPVLTVVLGTSIFETLELAALMSRLLAGAFHLKQAKVQGELDVAIECDPIATGESCNWGLGLALGRGMLRSKTVPHGKRWPKGLNVTRGTGEDAQIGNAVLDHSGPDLGLFGGKVELQCKRRDGLDGWGCITGGSDRLRLESMWAFEGEDFEPLGSERFFGLKSYGGAIFPVLSYRSTERVTTGDELEEEKKDEKRQA